jgi:hypothetical protein
MGTSSPEVKLDVNCSLLIRAFGTSYGGTSGIFFRNGYSTSGYYNCSILTYDHNADTFSDGLSINAYDGISFCTGSNTNTRQERMRINIDSNVGIGTTTPNNILQVGGAGRLRISNGTSDYTIIGTKDTDDNATNTKIFLNGNTFTGANNAGSIQYFATTATGAHELAPSCVSRDLNVEG